jgi:uncharacterized protein
MANSYYTADSIQIVDTDSHITEPPGLWLDHAPTKFKERVPRIVEDEQGRLCWMVDGRFLGPIGFTAIAPDGSRLAGDWATPDGGNRTFLRYEDVHKGAYDFEARLGWLDERGIHQQVLFPNVPGFGAVDLAKYVDDTQLRTACVTIYNDAAAEIQRNSGDRLLPLALVPWWDLEAVGVELDRARSQLGLTGITMCENPQEFGFRPLDQPEWDPFWSACEDLDLAVAFHIGSGGPKNMVWSQEGGGEFQATATVNSFLSNSWVVTNLIFSGILLKHPRLKIFSAETGIGWLPFVLEAMDYQWHENLVSRVKNDVWKAMLPSEVFRRNFYVAFWFEKFGPEYAMDIVGEDNIMFETDFPHGTALTDRTQEEVATTLAKLRPEVRRKVLRDNAARLFNLHA